MSTKPLLAVPNVSEGRQRATIDAIADAFVAGDRVRLLDVHSDGDHHRSVFTLAGAQGALSRALLAGTGIALERIDVGEERDRKDIGAHPHVGAVDVIPLVYLDTDRRGAACAEALVVAYELGEHFQLPVFLYGELAQGRTRAQLRRGGLAALGKRLSEGELRPDYGPSRPHPTGGATLVTAREPLVAFNLELAAPANVTDAQRIASLIREDGREGLPGVRAIGVPLHSSTLNKDVFQATPAENMNDATVVAQVSMNVERPLEVPLRVMVEAVSKHAGIACAEIVGLVPRATLEDFPADVELANFDPQKHIIENALGF